MPGYGGSRRRIYVVGEDVKGAMKIELMVDRTWREKSKKKA